MQRDGRQTERKGAVFITGQESSAGGGSVGVAVGYVSNVRY